MIGIPLDQPALWDYNFQDILNLEWIYLAQTFAMQVIRK